ICICCCRERVAHGIERRRWGCGLRPIDFTVLGIVDWSFADLRDESSGSIPQPVTSSHVRPIHHASVGGERRSGKSPRTCREQEAEEECRTGEVAYANSHSESLCGFTTV